MSEGRVIPVLIQSYNAAGHTAIVRPLDHPSATLGPLPVAANIDAGLVLAGAYGLAVVYDVGGAIIAIM